MPELTRVPFGGDDFATPLSGNIATGYLTNATVELAPKTSRTAAAQQDRFGRSR
ncbi:MAG: hypothetical protein AAFU85_27055 [Planctomycetota bacterium]